MRRTDPVVIDEPRLRDLPLRWLYLPRLLFLALIRLYQLTVARLLPDGICRFYPTCSHYTYQAVSKYGIIKGGALGFWRLLRCQPFSPGGYDPVP